MQPPSEPCATRAFAAHVCSTAVALHTNIHSLLMTLFLTYSFTLQASALTLQCGMRSGGSEILASAFLRYYCYAKILVITLSVALMQLRRPPTCLILQVLSWFLCFCASDTFGPKLFWTTCSFTYVVSEFLFIRVRYFSCFSFSGRILFLLLKNKINFKITSKKDNINREKGGKTILPPRSSKENNSMTMSDEKFCLIPRLGWFRTAWSCKEPL